MRKLAEPDDQVDARVEHQVDLAHVVGGAGHGVADRLQAVEGHALAEQAGVELVADVALEPLARSARCRSCAPAAARRASSCDSDDRAAPRCAPPPCRASAWSMASNARPTSTGMAPARAALPKAPSSTIGTSVPVAQHVRHHPPPRRRAVGAVRVVDDELGYGHQARRRRVGQRAGRGYAQLLSRPRGHPKAASNWPWHGDAWESNPPALAHATAHRF